MDNQEAIKILQEKISPCVAGEWKESVDMAISALQAQELSETQKPLDTISRQAAIDTVDSETVSTNPEHFKSSEKFIKFMDDADIASFGKWQWANGFNTAMVAVKIQLKKLPSAQPENIRCYECRYGTHSGCGNVYICNVSPELVSEHKADFYCGYAKRKTDEEVD